MKELIREGRKILQADPIGRAEPIIAQTTVDMLDAARDLSKLLKHMRLAVLAHAKSRTNKDWLQRSADALRK